MILGKNHVFRFTHPGQPREEAPLSKELKGQADKPDTAEGMSFYRHTGSVTTTCCAFVPLSAAGIALTLKKTLQGPRLKTC